MDMDADALCVCLDGATALSVEDELCLCGDDVAEAGGKMEKRLVAAVAKADSLGDGGEAIKEAVDKAMVVVKSIDLEALKCDLKGRGNVVMTRVADEDLEVIDTLVEAGLFDSRSECAAFLIRAGIDERKDLVGRVEDTAKQISKLKEDLKKDIG